MGGKDKKGPRTKGNTKPSSSGRSAELLGNVTEFVGFSGLPEGSYVPVIGANSLVEDASADSNIPADFRLSLRKMGKRDSTTKIKALQEFNELCEENSLETLKTILPFWPRIFSRLAVDGDRRVREYLHKSHLQLTSQLGRNLAPYLKEMMGAWFTSQSDTYAPAAFVAAHSLKTCFPGDKFSDAIAFCHNEIMDYIKDSILKENDFSDEQKERITIGGIAGYSLLLQQVKCDVLESEKYLLRHSEMWKNANLYKIVEQNKSLPIKQAWFGLIYSVVHYLPEVAKENSKRLLPSIFKFLDDSESTSQPALWETTLKILLTVENASSYVNLSSHATPKFLNLLRNACSGNARKIGPLIVPYVRLLREHKENQSQTEEFDRQVIEALFQGLLCRSIFNSSLEASALSESLFQLLDYIAKASGDSPHFKELLQSTVIPSLDLMVKSKCSELVVSAVIRQVTVTLTCWFRTDESVANVFWELLDNFIMSLITQSSDPDASLFENVALIILVLMDAHSKLDNRTKMNRRCIRIRFADTTTEDMSKGQETSPAHVPEMPLLFREKVVAMSILVCKDALKRLEVSDCETSLRLFASLMRCDDILRGFLAAESASSIDSMLSSIRRMLQKLRDKNTSFLFFTILDVMDSEFRCIILEDLATDEQTYEVMVSTALESSELSRKQVVLEWLRSTDVGDLLISTAKRVGVYFNEDENNDFAWSLLRAALAARQPSSQEPLLPKVHIGGIMEAFIQAFYAEHADENFIDTFVQKLSSTLKPSSQSNFFIDPSGEWLVSLVTVLCSSVIIQPTSANILLELWEKGASYAIHSRCQSAVAIIKNNLTAIPEFNVAERLVDIFQHVLELELTQGDHEASHLLARRVLLSDSEWMNWMKEASCCDLMTKEIMNGRYCHSNPITNNFKTLQLKNWYGLLNAAFVVSSIVVRNQHMFEQDRNGLIPYVFYATAVADILLEINRKRMKDDTLGDIDKISGALESNANSLLSSCSDQERTEVFRKTLLNSRQYRWIWCLAARKLQSVLQQSLEETEITENTVMIFCNPNDENLNRITQTQIAKLSAISSDDWAESFQLLASIRFLLEKLAASANDDTLISVAESVKILQSWQLKHDESFLFGQDLKMISRTESSVKAVWSIIEVIRLLSTIVEFYPYKLEHSSWDFILCSMTSWCTTFEESWSGLSALGQHTNPILLSFTVALSRLIQNCGALIADVDKKKEESISSLPPNLASEWNDVFSDAAYNAILPIFFIQSRSNNVSHLSSFCLMEAMALSVRHVPVKLLHQPTEMLSPLLLAKHSAIQFAAHGLISKLLPEIISAEATKCKEELDGDQEKTERSPPPALLLPIEKANLEDLDELRCGDLHTVEPYSQECQQILGYFLGWDLILRLCGSSDSELRYQYASYLTNSKLISRLMDILFCIIPHATFQQQANLDMEFRPDITLTEKIIQDIAIMIYSSALRHLPAVVRRWCNNADKRTASLVEKFTSRSVSW
ncbi:E3 ubiquitin-protein ligase listerin-like isoform X2 [Daphnia carinata]|uniref:E3 ubiquitin-protein ligase listerin-like isoform X2 n=1 Tax=Daphnia carinata TaxID=120202 RepID=UPI002868AB3A|nr:E3 ubiquitin-protein ligase listerin-like isoform X2 [Daphnia carinata]